MSTSTQPPSKEENDQANDERAEARHNTTASTSTTPGPESTSVPYYSDSGVKYADTLSPSDLAQNFSLQDNSDSYDPATAILKTAPENLEGFTTDPIFCGSLQLVCQSINDLPTPLYAKQLYVFLHQVENIIRSKFPTGWIIYRKPLANEKFSLNQLTFTRQVAAAIFSKVVPFMPISAQRQRYGLTTCEVLSAGYAEIPDAAKIQDPAWELVFPNRGRSEPLFKFALRLQEWCEINIHRDPTTPAFLELYTVALWNGHFKNFRDQCVQVQSAWCQRDKPFLSVDEAIMWFSIQPLFKAAPEPNNSRPNQSRNNKFGSKPSQAPQDNTKNEANNKYKGGKNKHKGANNNTMGANKLFLAH